MPRTAVLAQNDAVGAAPSLSPELTEGAASPSGGAVHHHPTKRTQAGPAVCQDAA